MKQVCLAAILLVATTAQACINDRDTLAFELRNVDAIKRVRQETDRRKRSEAAQEIALKAIGGRFERFPPKYYEMRIARLEAKQSLTAVEYDDLAVAYERLGKTAQAIDILLKSKPHRKTKDDDYRFHANYGTFLVHKWLAQTDREDTKALEQSIAEIEKALRINPNSHFGREQVQLDLERHWLNGKKLSVIDDIEQVVGLSGIVMMGLAYELPDAYALMTDLHLGAEITLLDDLALSRARELVTNGNAFVSQIFEPTKLSREPRAEIKDAYVQLRLDGEKVHQNRLAYIEQRLNRGEHPDTHSDFWQEWQEPPLPVLKRIPDPVHAAARRAPVVLIIVGIGAFLAAIGVFIWRRRAKSAPHSAVLKK